MYIFLKNKDVCLDVFFFSIMTLIFAPFFLNFELAVSNWTFCYSLVLWFFWKNKELGVILFLARWHSSLPIFLLRVWVVVVDFNLALVFGITSAYYSERCTVRPCRMQGRTRSAANKLEEHCKDLQKVELSFEEVKVAAIDRHGWCRVWPNVSTWMSDESTSRSHISVRS